MQDEIEDDLRKLQGVGKFHQVYPIPQNHRVEAMKRHSSYRREVDRNVLLSIDKVREIMKKR